jgi:hypothetical protein
MKDPRLYVLFVAFLLPFQACGPGKSDNPENSFSDNLPSINADFSAPAITSVSSTFQKLHEGRKDFAKKSGCGEMMEIEPGTVTQSLPAKICKSNWIPRRQYILLMENFIIENGALRECLSIKN